MKIYRYHMSVYSNCKIEIEEFECRETEKCYIAKNRKFLKEDLEFLDNYNYMISLNPNNQELFKQKMIKKYQDKIIRLEEQINSNLKIIRTIESMRG